MTPNNSTYSDSPNRAERNVPSKGASQYRTYDTSHIKPKKSPIPAIFAVLLAGAVLFVVVWGGRTLLENFNQPILADGEEVDIYIPEGAGAKDIGNLLQESGVITSSNSFVQRVNELGVTGQLKPGAYTLKGGMTLDQVIGVLRLGPDASYESFTIPEGFTLVQIAERVEEAYKGKITKEDFLAAARNASLYVNDYPFLSAAYNNSLEGFLFPKTYAIRSSATADSVVRMMLTQYQNEVASIDYGFAESIGLSRYDILIIASMIEREAMLAEEQAIVSSVIYNRMLIDMLLQIDATVAYAVGVVEITPADLSYDSPYNTYLYEGLPPGPICSPGLAAIVAAAGPAASGYFYYVASHEGDGSHYFSATYDEHLAYINSQ
ncbi:MAG: endolytic transglycosylase MltG [Eggerthellaceae bacterium]|nr:endolytic transglycosylase MltG [Eggerthellaceae bacterium]